MPLGLRTVVLLVLARSGLAQVVTENAGVVSPETPILREAVSVLESDEIEEVRWTSQLVFALDPARELKLTVPLVSREATFAGGAGAEEADLSGLGDVSLRFKQSLWQRDEVMASTRWALLAELGAPTGDDDAEEGGTPVPRRLQLGTGDWSLGAGTAYTWIRDRKRFSAEAFYRHRTRHDGMQLGPSADLNLAYWHRLAPAAFVAGEDAIEVRGVVELLGSYRFPSEIGGSTADDDGALVWLAPGLQVFPGTKVLFEASVQVPVYQDLDDDLGDRRWAATVAVKFLF